MEELNRSLRSLMQQAGSGSDLDIAELFAPILLLDSTEPFRPQAVGYKIYRNSGRSPSFPRQVKLATRRFSADLVIEYAFWWDWDINHLYELEHLWIYIDADDRIVGLEGSWHGSISDLYKQGLLKFKNDHPIVLAAPGKHAFALEGLRFMQHQSQFPGITSKYAGINGTERSELFAQSIERTPHSDRLVQSYLARYAFEPSWIFKIEIEINQILVPWRALESWIPGRISLWYQHLEKEISHHEFRPLAAVLCRGLADIHRASALGLDMVILNISGGRFGVPYLFNPDQNKKEANILRALRACYRSRIGVYLVVQDERTIPWLVRLLDRRDWSDYLMIGSARSPWLRNIKRQLPNYRTVLIQKKVEPELLERALNLGVSYVQMLSADKMDQSDDWIQKAHRAGIGLVAGPTANIEILGELGTKK